MLNEITARTEPAAPPKKIFISYTHDSPDHRQRVLALAERLRSNWVDARLDQYVEDTGVEWPEWTERQVEDADLVLIVCTAQYRAAFDDGVTAGRNKCAKWEARFIRRHIHDSDSENSKFLLVLLEESSPADIPKALRGSSYYSPTDQAGYIGLYRRISRQRRIVLRDLGSPLDLCAEPVELPPLPGQLARVVTNESDDYDKSFSQYLAAVRLGSSRLPQLSALPLGPSKRRLRSLDDVFVSPMVRRIEVGGDEQSAVTRAGRGNNTGPHLTPVVCPFYGSPPDALKTPGRRRPVRADAVGQSPDS